MKAIALASIRGYQRYLSHVLPPACRFEPTCSHYGYEAIDRHGVIRGSWLMLRRVGRCHPFRTTSYDPVP